MPGKEKRHCVLYAAEVTTLRRYANVYYYSRARELACLLACCPDWRPLQILFLAYRFPLVAAVTRFASSSVSVRDRLLVRCAHRPISGLATCAVADEALAIWASEAPEENHFLKICNRPYSCQNRIFTPSNSVRYR